MTTKTIQAIQERRSTFAIAPESDTRSVRAALSSVTPVPRFFGTEILRHDTESIDLSRVGESGLPLLINHDDSSLPIGRVRNVALEADGVLRGDLTFSEATQGSRDAWELAREGTLTDVSIRYKINDYEVRGDSGSEEYHVTNWTVLEASVVSVPADATVGIGRQLELEGIDMPDPNPEAPAVPEKPKPPSASRKAGEKDGEIRERKRINDIDLIASNFPENAAVQDLARAARTDGTSVEDFKSEMIGALAPEYAAQPLAKPVPQPQISAGLDASENMRAGITAAFDIKAGNLKGEDARQAGQGNPYLGLSIIETGRKMLEAGGVRTHGMSPLDVAGALLEGSRYIDPGTANLTTANFPAVLEDVINKALFRGFEEAPVTWNIWCGTDSAQDFKPGTRPGLSAFTSLAVVAENAAIADGIVNDKKEAFQIATYARKFSVTRQSLVNDDLAALANIASRMGQAAGRTVDEQVYAFVDANGNMTEDGNPLFDATNHSNLDATVNAEPSTENIGKVRVAMGKQTDTNSVILGIVPQYMVTPLELEQKMLEISTLNADPIRTRRDNVYRTMWTPVSTPRLASARSWYMFGGMGDTINVVFLNGQQSPMMARDEGWSTLAAHWRIVLDFTVMAVDYRAAYKFSNPAT